MDAIRELAESIHKAKNITVLSGAGMSTESGIPDFKSTDENWSYTLPRHILLSTGYYQGQPKEFWEVYKDIFQIKLFGDYKPNFGHEFLANLEKLGKKVTICTQNVDGLHIVAGSTNVYEIHGNIRTAHCPKCKTVYDLEYINSQGVPRCNKPKGNNNTCNFILYPDVVLFGDQIHHYKESVQSVMNADLFIALGSDLDVQPINELPLIAYHNLYRDKLLETFFVNLTPTTSDSFFNTIIREKIGTVFRKVDEIMKELP